MRLPHRKPAGRAVLVALALLWIGPGPAAAFEESDLRIPMAAAGPEGLEAVMVHPGGAGPHPLALVSHGSPRNAGDRPGMTARGMMPQLRAFAARGFLAVSVLRRGYGSSEGGWAEGFGPCDGADYIRAGRAGAADLKAAIAYLSRRDDVDATRIVAVGHSAGGFATVALTAEAPPGLVAAISFAGGRGSRGPDEVCDAQALVRAFGTFGARSRVPMLWVYAENDRFFGPTLAQEFHEAFQAGEGRADFVSADAYGADGHALFTAGGQAAWGPFADPFLARHGFGAATRTAPAAPRTTAPSAATELRPPSRLGAKGRGAFDTYLQAAGSKAFAISESGGYGWRTGRRSPDEAMAAALENCERASGADCHLYAVDDAYASDR